jgi:DNA-binding transcriptional ArsR family regulator
MREVNKDFIACIHNNGRRAKYCEYEIEDFSYKIEELEDFVRSSSRSVSEIKSKYRELFPFKFWWQGYCLENEYNDVEYTVVSNPLDVFVEYEKELKREIKIINSEYKDIKAELIKEGKRNFAALEKKQKKALEIIEKQLLEEYAEDFLEAVKEAKDAINYELTLNKIRDNAKVVAYSSDQKGWSDFSFLKINKDLGIQVKTNFCYGNSSYFIVTIIYKDVPIVPYSYIVTYYNARAIDIIRGTKWFARRRSSWKPALEFAIECANEAKNEPVKFVNDFITSELDTLVTRISKFVKNPDCIIPILKENDSTEVELSYIHGIDIESMLIYEDEMSPAITAIKVTDSLSYISSLNKLVDDFEPISKYLGKILYWNRRLKKTIIELLNKVNDTLPTFEKECTNIESKIRRVDKAIKPHQDAINKLTSRVRQSRQYERLIEGYTDNHPEYEKLIFRKEILTKDLETANDRLLKRRRFANKLSSLIEYIDSKLTEGL